jgi:cytochrome P450
MGDPSVVIEQLYAGQSRVPHYPRFAPPFYIIYRYDDVQTVLRRPETFVSGRGQGPNFVDPTGIVSDPPDHTFFRALVQDVFQPQAIARLQPRLEAIADELLSAVAHQAQWDLHDALAFPLPIRIICEILGIPSNDIWTFKAWSDASVAALASEQPSAYAAARTAMAGYVERLLREKRTRPDDSLVSRIANGERDGRAIPDSEALSLITQMFVAGNETTTSLITNFVWRISKLGLWDDFVTGRFDLDLAINESLRFDPPLLALFRTTAHPVTIGGHDLPAGVKVMVHYAAANRDPDAFDQPDEFVPERRRNRHVAFALGIHSCLGRELAKLEARVALEALRRRYPRLEILGDGERIPPFLFWGRSALPVAHRQGQRA